MTNFDIIDKRFTEFTALVLYALLLTNQFINTIKIQFQNVGYKKKAHCLVSGETDNYSIIFVAKFPESMIELPIDFDGSLTPFQNYYVLPRLKINKSQPTYLIIDVEFLPFDLMLSCFVYYKSNMYNDAKILHKKDLKINLSPIKPFSNVTCNSNINGNYYWKCEIDGNFVPLGYPERNFRTQTLFDFYNSLFVNDNKLSLYYFHVPNTFQCICYMDIDLPETRKVFYIPELYPSLTIIPKSPKLFKELKCFYNEIMGDLLYYWGCTSPKPNEDTEFIQSLKIMENVLYLSYYRLSKEYKCFCKVKFKYFNSYQAMPSASFQLPQLETLKLIPTEVKYNDTVICVTDFKQYYKMEWFCKFDDKSILMNDRNNKKSLSRYSQLIFDEINIDPYDKINLNLRWLYENLYCYCRTSYYTITPQKIMFVLVRSEIPQLKLKPKEFEFNKILLCSSDFAKFFLYFWSCLYNNETILLHHLKLRSDLGDELKYFSSAINVLNHNLIVSELWLFDDIQCKCFINLVGKKFPLSSAIEFTIPKSQKSIFSFIDIDCSENCVYDSNINQTFTLDFQLNYPLISKFVNIFIFSTILSLSEYLPIDPFISFHPLAGIGKVDHFLCLNINWNLCWKDVHQEINNGFWTILVTKSGNETEIMSNLKHINIKFNNKLTFQCYLNDYNDRSVVMIYTFSVYPILFINSFFVDKNTLKIVPTSKFKQEFTITCAVSIFSVNILMWCRLYMLANMMRRIIVNYYRNISVPLYNVQFGSGFVRISVTMAYPIKVVFEKFNTSMDVSYKSYFLNSPEIPEDMYLFNILYSADGFYQFFCVYNISNVHILEKKVLNYVFIHNKISLVLNPSTVLRGYSVSCTSNSLDILFIFHWFCFLHTVYVKMELDVNLYDSKLRNEFSNFLYNIILIDSQTLKFKHLLNPGSYYCFCKVETYPVYQNKFEFFESFIFDFKPYDYTTFMRNFPTKLHAYVIVGNFLWVLVLMFVFLLIASYQQYEYKMCELKLHLSLNLGFILIDEAHFIDSTYGTVFIYDELMTAADFVKFVKEDIKEIVLTVYSSYSETPKTHEISL